MRAISSVRMTVLPSPAPPKRPILPPRTNGVSRSMTLMPVSNTLGLGREVCRTAAGRGGSASAPAPATGPRPSIGSPSRLKTRPSVSLPTGTLTGPPVSTTGMPADQAVGRAQGHAPDPVAAEVLLDLAGQVDLDALVLGRRPSGRCRCSGRWPSSNSASKVEPITWAIRPVCGRGGHVAGIPRGRGAWDARR